MSDAHPTDIPTEGQQTRPADLEAAQEERQERHRLDRRFELTEAILLSLAAVLGAWTGFQATKWSGVQANEYSLASATRIEANRAAELADQQRLSDIVLFTEWLAAAEREGILQDLAESGHAYEPDSELLSGFLYLRFRPEFAVAVEAWLATDPRGDPEAPPSPFAMPEYQLAAEQDAAELDREADGHAADARSANQRSDNYVLMTIMFATVLFFAGISSKMDTARARIFLLGMGTFVLVVSIAVVLSFPKEL